MLKNRNKFVEVGFQIPSGSCRYWHCGMAHVSSGYSVGGFTNTECHSLNQAKEKILLTEGATCLSALQHGTWHA